MKYEKLLEIQWKNRLERMVREELLGGFVIRMHSVLLWFPFHICGEGIWIVRDSFDSFDGIKSWHIKLRVR
jgi:hypothetical protein